MKESRTKKIDVYVCEGCGYEWESKQWTCFECDGDVGTCCGVLLVIHRYGKRVPYGKPIKIYYHPNCFEPMRKFLGDTMNINLLPICKPEGS